MPDEMLIENEGEPQEQIIEQEQYEYVDKELPPQLQPQHVSKRQRNAIDKK